MKTILILGAGIMQEPAIRRAKAMGWRVILADGNPQASARGLADRFENVDLKNREGLLALARAVKESAGLDGVFTAGTDFSCSVAWVAENLGLPGISYETAMRATDKHLMRETFAKSGVPSPLFTTWEGGGDPLSRLPEGLGFPLVVKPVDNMGARGVRRVDRAEDLVEACRAALRLSRSSRVIIEEFIEGPEFSLDAVVYRGEISICGVADRHICFPPWFVEMGHTIPTDVDGPALRAIESVFRAGIRAIGIDNGAAKGDIKLTPTGPMVGEIAARLSGGYMSGWTFPLSSGVEVTAAALNISVGLPPGDLAPRLRLTCAERALISIPGIVDHVIGVEEARALPGVQEIFLRVSPGDTVVFPSNNVEKCGNVLAVGASRGQAVEAASRALSCMRIRLRPLVDVTSRFLFGDDAPGAFDGAAAELHRALRGLPPFLGDLTGFDPEEPIAVLPLAGWEQRDGKDWHGTELADAVRLALSLARGELRERPGRFALAGLFWRAVLRAGSQGGTYILDSVREAARRGTLKELLESP